MLNRSLPPIKTWEDVNRWYFTALCSALRSHGEPFGTQPLNNPELLRPFVLGNKLLQLWAIWKTENIYLSIDGLTAASMSVNRDFYYYFTGAVSLFLSASSVLLSFTDRVQEANGAFRFPPSEVLNSGRVWAYHFTVPPTSFTSYWLTRLPITHWSRLLTQWRKFVSSRYSTQGCHLELIFHSRHWKLG